MKRLYLFLLTAIMSIGSIAAQTTVTVGFDIDHPEAVKNFNINFTDLKPQIHSGMNYFEMTIEEGNTLGLFTMMELNEGYMFQSVTPDEDATMPNFGTSTTMFSMSLQPSDDNKTWVVRTVALADARTASFTLNIDDPAKVKLREDKSKAYYTLAEGVNTIPFIPGEGNTLTLQPQSYYDPIYKVEHNATRLNPNSNGEYVFAPTAGDVVDVQALMPNVSVPVHFTYSEGAESVISSVTIDYQPVEFNGTELNVQVGKEVCLRMNDGAFAIAKIEIDGVDQGQIYSSFYFTPMAETNVYIEAHPYGNITAYITIDDADNVLVYQGYAYENRLLTLQSGRNTLQLPERDAKVCVWHSEAGRVISITDGTNEYTPGQYSTIQLTDGMELNITTSPYQRDKHLVVWLDSRDVFSSFYFSLGTYDFRTEAAGSLTTGYNHLMIDPEIDNPATLNWYIPSAQYNAVFVNDEQIAASYPGGTYYYLPRLEDGTVVKIYVASEATRHDTQFVVEEDLDISVTCDFTRPMSVGSEPVALLHGTHVRISAPEGTSVKVDRNGVAIAADDDGSFTFIAESPSQVNVSRDLGSSINEVNEWSGRVDVYNLQGVCIWRGMDRMQLSTLPAGIYIVAGRKVVVR